MSDSEDGIGRLEAKLDTLIRLTALTVIANQTTLKEKAGILNRAGLPPKEIALLTGSTANTISVLLSAAKREAKGQ